MFGGFFLVVIAVNYVFITTALDTHTGVVVDKAYERGLAFDSLAEKQKAQPKLTEKFEYKDGSLSWRLQDEKGTALENATVKARLYRAVQDGYDKNIEFENKGRGLCESNISLPLKGEWSIRLKAAWDSQNYQSVKTFIAR